MSNAQTLKNSIIINNMGSFDVDNNKKGNREDMPKSTWRGIFLCLELFYKNVEVVL